jgi:hypothetical protein
MRNLPITLTLPEGIKTDVTGKEVLASTKKGAVAGTLTQKALSGGVEISDFISGNIPLEIDKIGRDSTITKVAVLIGVGVALHSLNKEAPQEEHKE